MSSLVDKEEYPPPIHALQHISCTEGLGDTEEEGPEIL